MPVALGGRELLRPLLDRLPLTPLYGGGFWVAYAQLCLFYYSVGALLHFVLPRLVPVHGIQQQPRKRGEVARDAFYSLGECALSALGAASAHHVAEPFQGAASGRLGPACGALMCARRPAGCQGRRVGGRGGPSCPRVGPDVRRAHLRLASGEAQRLLGPQLAPCTWPSVPAATRTNKAHSTSLCPRGHDPPSEAAAC
jgi:hypothetical protein